MPPIEHFCERYQIPDEAAGASFLAFGSSAPEIVIASIATLGGADPEGAEGSETGLSTVLGSAVLAFGLIPAVSFQLAAQLPPELTSPCNSASLCSIISLPPQKAALRFGAAVRWTRHLCRKAHSLAY